MRDAPRTTRFLSEGVSVFAGAGVRGACLVRQLLVGAWTVVPACVYGPLRAIDDRWARQMLHPDAPAPDRGRKRFR